MEQCCTGFTPQTASHPFTPGLAEPEQPTARPVGSTIGTNDSGTQSSHMSLTVLRGNSHTEFKSLLHRSSYLELKKPLG